MNKEFSIYESPLSDETKNIRRNFLLMAGLCLFIGLTENLPTKFALLGIEFSDTQQITLGWFIFSVTIYHFIHFLSVASVEVAAWVNPFYISVLSKRELLKHPAFDDTDFIDMPGQPPNEQDKDLVVLYANYNAKWNSLKKLKYLYSFIYVKLIIEILAPVIIGIWGAFELWQLITSHST